MISRSLDINPGPSAATTKLWARSLVRIRPNHEEINLGADPFVILVFVVNGHVSAFVNRASERCRDAHAKHDLHRAGVAASRNGESAWIPFSCTAGSIANCLSCFDRPRAANPNRLRPEPPLGSPPLHSGAPSLHRDRGFLAHARATHLARTKFIKFR